MKDKGTSELKKLEDNKAPGTLFTAAPATTANEAFRRVNEDPLLRMRCVCACACGVPRDVGWMNQSAVCTRVVVSAYKRVGSPLVEVEVVVGSTAAAAAFA